MEITLVFALCVKHRVLFLPVVVIATIASGPLYGPKGLENHPALDLYPSPEEWQQRIAAAKGNDPEGFAAARADFDLAIRSSVLHWHNCPIVKKHRARMHVLPKSILWGTTMHTREGIADLVSGWQEDGEVDPWDIDASVAWLRSHMEELVVDDSPMMRIVLADMLLNPWNDWSQWEGYERLDALRAECPHPHQYFAWDLAGRFGAREFTGLALRWLPQAHARERMNITAMAGLIGASKNARALDYLLKATTLPLPDYTLGKLVSTARRVAPASAEDYTSFRDVWAQYITSPKARVRAEAVFKLGDMIRRIRIHTKGKDNSEALQAKLQQIADNDPDKEVRERAKFRLEDIRNARWKE